MDNKKQSWEESYQKKDNFLFYPHEEIIRFFAKHISQRTGLTTFKKKHSNEGLPKVLDLGCGIGRHVIFSHEMQTEAYGVDLSESAISFAIDWAEKEGIQDARKRIIQSDITQMPFQNDFFDFVVSHGVLDSMSANICQKAIADTHRVMKPGGYFYCDLISGDDSAHNPDFSGEEIVQTEHEKNTIQLYFNRKTINDFFSPYFDIVEIALIRRTNSLNNQFISRYHIVLKKK
ncbi:MAG: class I SAM-dependent methyltransferase [Bacteroidia bacterium]